MLHLFKLINFRKMKLPKSLILLSLILVMLSGCATPELSGLSPIQNGKSFNVKEMMVSNTGLFEGPAGDRRYGIAPGVYLAEQENALGTFYKGPRYGVFYAVPQGFMVRSGGVWVPRNPMLEVKVYAYFDLEWTQVDDYQSAISLQVPKEGRDGAKLDTAQLAINNAPKGSPIIHQAVGGAIAYALIDAVIAADRGKPAFIWDVADKEMNKNIRALVNPGSPSLN